MFCRSMLVAVLGLFLSGCAVYDYDHDYDGYSGYPRYYNSGDYVMHRYDDPPVLYPYYLSDHRRFGHHRHDFRGFGDRMDHRFDPRFDRRFDRRFDPRFDRRFDPRFDPRFDRRFDPRFDRRFDHRFDRRFDHRFDHRFDRRFDHRFDKRFDHRRFDRRFDNFHKRRHDFTPRLRIWGQNDRQQFQVQPGYMVRLIRTRFATTAVAGR